MRRWWSDGVAASTTTCGIFGHILAFRSELEAQGNVSLHPHILILLLNIPLHLLLRLLKKNKAALRQRLRRFMRMTVAVMEATCQSSVQTLPRIFGDTSDTATAPAFKKGEQSLCAYDGGCELDNLRAIETKKRSPTRFLGMGGGRDLEATCLAVKKFQRCAQ